MAEIGIPYSLDTPLGTIDFAQDGGDGIQIRGVAGLDGAPIRAPVSNRPQSDGLILHNFWRSGIYPVLNGIIKSTSQGSDAACLEYRRELEDTLRAYTGSLIRAEGTLRWTPSGAAERQITVRLLDAVNITGSTGPIKEWVAAFVSADSLIYAAIEDENDTNPILPGVSTFSLPFTFPFSLGTETTGGDAEVVNLGTVATWPTLEIHGPATSPTVRNVTTGKELRFTDLALEAGDYIEVDTHRELLTLNGSPLVSMLRYLEPSTSEFWQLEPGPNSIQFLGGTVGSGAKVTVRWRDAYI